MDHLENTEEIPTESTDAPEEKPFLSVIVHSFFIIPFLIAVFCVLLFTGIHLLTREKRTVYDYLEDVKTGGLTKRWQGAFELSKILSNPALLPEDNRFSNELISAFEHAEHDDDRVRQYLALAMGRTQRPEFLEPLLKGLAKEKEGNLPAVIYALGMLQQKEAANAIHPYTDHPDARVRSIAVTALGQIGNLRSKPVLFKGLSDPEPNVQWGAALSLARMGDPSGRHIIFNLLDREYLAQFPEVDPHEENQLILMAIETSKFVDGPDLRKRLKELSQTDKNMNVRAAAFEQLRN